MIQKLTTQFKLIGLVAIALDAECYRWLCCFAICDRGAIGKWSRVVIVGRLETVGGCGFPGGEWISEGRHVVYVLVGYRAKSMHQTQCEYYEC